MINNTVYTKDPDDKIDYYIDYNSWLNGTTISTSVWTIDSGITSVSTSFSAAGVCKIVVSGGTIGTTYKLTNKITTVAGTVGERIKEESIYICIESK